MPHWIGRRCFVSLPSPVSSAVDLIQMSSAHHQASARLHLPALTGCSAAFGKGDNIMCTATGCRHRASSCATMCCCSLGCKPLPLPTRFISPMNLFFPLSSADHDREEIELRRVRAQARGTQLHTTRAIGGVHLFVAAIHALVSLHEPDYSFMSLYSMV